jgi:hypothetical protein
MKSPDDLWSDLGELPDEEVILLVTKLFSFYEERLNKNSGDTEAINFFRNLDNALNQTSQCNLNRR